jgi:hypothetical protein
VGVDTKAILRKDVSLEEIKETLETKYSNVDIISTSMGYYFYVVFDDGGSHRNLNIMFSNIALHDYGIDGVLASLGCWGNSKEVMMLLLNKFGGYLDENDCDDKEFEPVNIELFEQAKDLTAKDKLINEIIHKLGYDKLKAALEIFDRYVSSNLTEVIADAYEFGLEDGESHVYNRERNECLSVIGLETITKRLLEKYTK